MRKVVGAQRRQLARQLISESLSLSVISLFLSVGLACLLLPFFSSLIERNIQWKAVFSWHFGLVLGGAAALTGLISGLYPSLVLASLDPVSALKKTAAKGSMRFSLRNLLVGFQFGITSLLIIASLVIFQQINFIKNKDLGFNRDQVVVMWRSDPGVTENYESFKHALQKNPHVLGITTSSSIPTNIRSSGSRETSPGDDGEKKHITANWILTDEHFLDVFDMDIETGRNFSASYGTDENNAVIINQAFQKRADWSSPLGQRIFGWSGGKVIGVVKDFHFHSLRSEVAPLFISFRPHLEDVDMISIRISPHSIPVTLAHIRRTYNRFRTTYPFDYFFLDDRFNDMYTTEQKLGSLLTSFAGLAVIISCLGVFGLISFRIQQRTKEIGIRKILGASDRGIISILLLEFLKWVLTANILSWLPAYIIMNQWLRNFAFRTDLRIGTFAISTTAVILLALISIGYRTFKAARTDPVRSLRYE
jgi:putative ABC transport system permease protein